MSAPKGTGFVYVRPDKQKAFRPVCLSSRANKVRPERALFLRDFDYQGTDDYSATLTMPHSLAAMGKMLPGGWPALLRHNHELIMAGRKRVCDILGLSPPAPESMIGTMASLLIPEPAPELANRPTIYDDALQDELYNNHRIIAPIWRLNDNRRVVRLSAQVYNRLEQFEKLGHALAEELGKEQRYRATA
jgi:isopenicillin-N epimerase